MKKRRKVDDSEEIAKIVGKIQGGGKICRELITKIAVVDPTRVSKRKLKLPS